ncbi:hypothetical protein RhiirA4_491032 [Rhizophagus irregularis]|uniref:Uncharacterized protein n=1 Tax=Rhizophagus irregularis TaxID=588596 RepID=A0A2I1HW95_9GLOM|nr:hypothetical protein RhiirA4_491032 [Rhizophagus irregularis]
MSSKAIAIENGGAKQVLNVCNKLIMPGFVSSWFYLHAVLIIYVGGGFYTSIELKSSISLLRMMKFGS